MTPLPFKLPPVTEAELALESDIEATSALLDVFEVDPMLADQYKAALQKLVTLVNSRTPEQMLRMYCERRGT